MKRDNWMVTIIALNLLSRSLRVSSRTCIENSNMAEFGRYYHVSGHEFHLDSLETDKAFLVFNMFNRWYCKERMCQCVSSQSKEERLRDSIWCKSIHGSVFGV